MKGKRILSVLLAFAFVFGTFTAIPTTVFAQDDAELDTLLDEYIEENYYGKITVTIAASRPIANSRAVFNIEDMSAGHTYIRLDFGDGNVMIRGFSPIDDLSVLAVMNNTTVEGKLEDKATKDWNAAIVYEITLEQANAIKDYADSFDPANFNIIFNNCTTFAVNALMTAGISPPTEKHNWIFPTRDEAIAAMPPYILDKERFVNELLSRIYYGYTPADAVQDFKSNANCILKYNGTLHKP